ncbi:unnamed protein product [Pleuronectes platessa]|uniref:Uncharacterized protein n=1 Tax=Pleuronectes platessa TaxID=8262 RepID=A0A9N7VHI1_PLEPL|nr:unnamed protein product [Pleuronectes platessa]
MQVSNPPPCLLETGILPRTQPCAARCLLLLRLLADNTRAGELWPSSKDVPLRQLEDADKKQQLSEREDGEAMVPPSNFFFLPEEAEDAAVKSEASSELQETSSLGLVFRSDPLESTSLEHLTQHCHPVLHLQTEYTS